MAGEEEEVGKHSGFTGRGESIQWKVKGGSLVQEDVSRLKDGVDVEA